MENKYVYSFYEGDAKMIEILGRKGANLSEMANLGFPIPHGFTITTQTCMKYYQDGGLLTEDVRSQILNALSNLESSTGKKLGDKERPLLLSVRSGSREIMPGMMDTILNIGMNDTVLEIMSQKNAHFAYETYCNFIQAYGNIVMGIPIKRFQEVRENITNQQNEKELSVDDLKNLCQLLKEVYYYEKEKEFPSNPIEQLEEAIKAVFRSWNNPRAITYRRIKDISSNWGTAAVIQEMVFGNLDENSGTGNAYSRDPVSGEKRINGNFLKRAQGEELLQGNHEIESLDKLREMNEKAYEDVLQYIDKLEKHYKDMQEIEFTIENGKLYLLQTRRGERTGKAALKIATDMVKEERITQKEAILNIEPEQLEEILYTSFAKEELEKAEKIATGISIIPDVVVGKVIFSISKALEWKEQGEKTPLILIKDRLSIEDIQALELCEGIITREEAMTSHLKVLLRSMGKCCIIGCHSLDSFEESKLEKIIEGDMVSIDGVTGTIYKGELNIIKTFPTEELEKFMQWVDHYRTLKVRANADTKEEAKKAYDNGAEGIGLCRTENVFLYSENIAHMQTMLVSEDLELKQVCLTKMLEMQLTCFKQLYQVMKGYPVTIRLLDISLDSLFPKKETEIERLAMKFSIEKNKMKEKISKLREYNPMLGNRGSRLMITYPEILEVQIKAILLAAIEINEKENRNIVPEIILPLIGEAKEIAYIKEMIREIADKIIEEKQVQFKYRIGSMIETPRACMISNEIAREVEFFSFGTNDLTQFTFGISRDDGNGFLVDYYDKAILEFNPFEKLDEKSVGRLIELAIESGKKARPDIQIGICGEQAANSKNVNFYQKIGMDYISCAPHKILPTKLAAAQAYIETSEA